MGHELLKRREKATGKITGGHNATGLIHSRLQLSISTCIMGRTA
jgi:hypothetical protein